MRTLWAMLFLGLVTTSSAQADDTPWARLMVAEHPVSVELPRKVKSRHHTSDWGVSRAESDMLEIDAFGGKMSATATIAPMLAIRFAGQDLIHLTTRDTVLRGHKGQRTSWDPVRRSGLDGRRMTYTAQLDGKPMIGVMEVYVFDTYIVTFDTLLPPDAPKQTAEHFFRSIRLKELAR